MWQNTVNSLRSKNFNILFQLCVSINDLLLGANLRWNSSSGKRFSIFVVLRNHAEGKSVTWPPFWNVTLFIFFADNHSATYSINGAIFIRKIPLESGFLKGIHPPFRHPRVGNTLVTNFKILKKIILLKLVARSGFM